MCTQDKIIQELQSDGLLQLTNIKSTGQRHGALRGSNRLNKRFYDDLYHCPCLVTIKTVSFPHSMADSLGRYFIHLKKKYPLKASPPLK
jgi:hypothetical protein